jgi:CRP-like cAMP-binding protein
MPRDMSRGPGTVFCQDDSIIVEGDAMCSVSLLTAGHAKTVRHSAVGKLVILHVAGPGDVLDGLGYGREVRIRWQLRFGALPYIDLGV